MSYRNLYTLVDLRLSTFISTWLIFISESVIDESVYLKKFLRLNIVKWT